MNSKDPDLCKSSVLKKSIHSILTCGGPTTRSVVWQNSIRAQSLGGAGLASEHQKDTLVEDGMRKPSHSSRGAMLKRKELLEDGGSSTAPLVEDSGMTQTRDGLTLSCQVITSLTEFESLGPLWEKFDVDPMSGFDWNYSWWKSFQKMGDLHLITFEQAGEVVGLAPFFVDRWFGLSRLRFLAAGDVCSDYIDIICDPAHYELCAASFAQYIRAMNFDMVELECTKGNRLAQLLSPQLEDNYRIDQREAEPTWRLDLPKSWEEFVSSTKSSLRRKIKKAVRRIDSGEIEISSTADGLDLDSAFKVLEQLHTQRFNSMDKPGVFADDRFTDFLNASAKELCSRGKCEIVVAAKNGKPFATQIYFEGKEGFQFYQSGCDPDTMKLEPGHLMFTFMVRRAIERGDHVFDFLRGNEPYKLFWGASPHSQWKVRMISRSTLPTLAFKTIEIGRRFLRR